MRPTGDEKRYGAALLLAGALFFACLFIGTRPLATPQKTFPSSFEAAAFSTGGPAASGSAGALNTPFPGFPIDINTATREELMMLPGIGPKTAARILDKRDEIGRFGSMDELLTIKRMRRAGVDKLRSLASVR
ncbi:MAG: helix-hairpin-helix domain-containing protein [Deltaproteobacteria bacterium]|nr:helix-hairpin-helix domain-containing protein [Deltaproteobacteria bacterium]